VIGKGTSLGKLETKGPAWGDCSATKGTVIAGHGMRRARLFFHTTVVPTVIFSVCGLKAKVPLVMIATFTVVGGGGGVGVGVGGLGVGDGLGFGVGTGVARVGIGVGVVLAGVGVGFVLAGVGLG